MGWLGYVVVVGSWAMALLFLSYPLYGWAAIAQGGAQTWGLPFLPSALLHLVAGAYAAVIASWIAIGVASGQRAVASFLLATSREEELDARVETLTESRRRAGRRGRRRAPPDRARPARRRPAAAGRARHDARPGRPAVRRPTPTTARKLVEEAHGETKDALVDLRNLARGIHPAVLTDRGLDAALSGARRALPAAGRRLGPGRARGRQRDHRGHRLLRRQRGPDQRGQARQAPPRPGQRAAHRRPADRRGRRRRRRRGRPRARAPAWPACATGSPSSTAR